MYERTFILERFFYALFLQALRCFLFVLVVIIPGLVFSQTSQPNTSLEAVTGSQPLRDGIEVQAGSASLRITALRDDIIRVRIAPGKNFPEDASWAVLPEPRGKSVNVQPAARRFFSWLPHRIARRSS